MSQQVDISIHEPRWWAVLQSVSCAFVRILKPDGMWWDRHMFYTELGENAMFLQKLGRLQEGKNPR